MSYEAEREKPDSIDLKGFRRTSATPRLSRRQSAVPPGTLDVLVLKALQCGHLSKCEIRKRINQLTNGAVVVPQSSINRSIGRLHRWLRKESGRSSQNRQATLFYLPSEARSHQKAEVWRLCQKLEAVVGALKN